MREENNYIPTEEFLKECWFHETNKKVWICEDADTFPFSICYFQDRNFFKIKVEVYETDLNIQSDSDLLTFLKIINAK